MKSIDLSESEKKGKKFDQGLQNKKIKSSTK